MAPKQARGETVDARRTSTRSAACSTACSAAVLRSNGRARSRPSSRTCTTLPHVRDRSHPSFPRRSTPCWRARSPRRPRSARRRPRRPRTRRPRSLRAACRSAGSGGRAPRVRPGEIERDREDQRADPGVDRIEQQRFRPTHVWASARHEPDERHEGPLAGPGDVRARHADRLAGDGRRGAGCRSPRSRVAARAGQDRRRARSRPGDSRGTSSRGAACARAPPAVSCRLRVGVASHAASNPCRSGFVLDRRHVPIFRCGAAAAKYGARPPPPRGAR